MNIIKRYNELDSLRGVASISVVLSHFSVVIPSFYLFSKFKNTPVHIFWAGHEAVILFFLLSGFVLSLPYFNKNRKNYLNYIIKRVCRIYIPYIVSIFISIILMVSLYRKGIPKLAQWSTWKGPITLSLLRNHMLLLGSFNVESLNPVIWSLIHEMRISLIFPYLILLVVRKGILKNLVVIISFPLMIFSSYYLCLKLFGFDLMKYQYNSSSILLTINYIPFFLLGAFLAKYTHLFEKFYRKMNSGSKLSILLLGILAYTYVWWFPYKVSILNWFIIQDWFIAIGGIIFILFSINSYFFKRILLIKPVHFVGKISYSLYLFHLPCLFSLYYIFYGKLSIYTILIFCFILSITLASIVYFLIEKPSIRLGNFLVLKKANSIILLKRKIS